MVKPFVTTSLWPIRLRVPSGVHPQTTYVQFPAEQPKVANLVAPPSISAPDPAAVLPGVALTAIAGVWTKADSVSGQWLRDGVPIAGATGQSYLVQAGDIGTGFTYNETAQPGGVVAVSNALACRGPAKCLASTVAVEAYVVPGSSVVANFDWVGADSVAISWLRNGVAIAGQAASQYILSDADVGTTISCRQVGQPGSVAQTVASSSQVHPSATLVTAPVLSGNSSSGLDITATWGVWTNLYSVDEPQTGAWLRDGQPIAGMGSITRSTTPVPTYTMTDADIGHTIQFHVSAMAGFAGQPVVANSNGLVGKPFDVRSLFANGEQGAWYDPSDLSTLFQDAAGTVPVTAVGQPVGKVLDKSGRVNHLTQSTASMRPLLQQDSAGLYYLAWDGTNTRLASANIDFTATDKLSLWAGIRKNTDAVLGILLETSADGSSNPGAFQVLAPSDYGTNTVSFQARGSTGATLKATSIVAPRTFVVTGQAQISGAYSLRIDGVLAASTSNPAGIGTLGNYPLYVGRRVQGNWPFNGRLYALIIRGAASTQQQVTNVEKYVAGRSGITLAS